VAHRPDNQLIFHIDGNSFYASCERIFRPDLEGRPIVVLTNNDALIIALNKEAKEAGFKRGDNFSQNRRQLEKLGAAVFSSNYTLYADISSRLNMLYNRYTPEVEFYSIDESFLYFPDNANAGYQELGQEILTAAKTEIGVPVAVGIAPNKTLAKLCNHLAKKTGGVCEWAALDSDTTLASLPAGSIWGIGRKKQEFLAKRGIKTALDLKNYPRKYARSDLTINGERTIRELNGERVIGKHESEPRQQIIVSRTFSGPVYKLEEISAALADYTQEAVKRMRGDGLACTHLTVFLMGDSDTSHSSAEAGSRYCNSALQHFEKPTSFYPRIAGAAFELLRQIFRQGYAYRKTLVCLSGMHKECTLMPDLFDDIDRTEKEARLMACLDGINRRYGRGAIKLAAATLREASGAHPAWESKREFLSPAYTTSLTGLPKVY
jgi:DNA polymerase V